MPVSSTSPANHHLAAQRRGLPESCLFTKAISFSSTARPYTDRPSSVHTLRARYSEHPEDIVHRDAIVQ